MPNKTVKFTLQSEPNGDQDVNILVTVDNVAVFNQAVPAMGPVVLDTQEPSESFTFDLDVAASGNVGVTEIRNFGITATNGVAKIRNITCNFSASSEQVGNVFNLVPGSSNTFVICNIVSQPTWNGDVLLGRYDIQYNNGAYQVTGPGEVLIEDGEVAVFDVAVPAYNDSSTPA